VSKTPKTSRLSPTTAALVARLDKVIAAIPQPGSIEENELMAAHVRCVLTPEGEPMFTEDVLKLAYVELLHSAG